MIRLALGAFIDILASYVKFLFRVLSPTSVHPGVGTASPTVLSVIFSVDVKKPTLPLKSGMHPAIVEQDNALISHQRRTQERPSRPAIARPQGPRRRKATQALRTCQPIPLSLHNKKTRRWDLSRRSRNRIANSFRCDALRLARCAGDPVCRERQDEGAGGGA